MIWCILLPEWSYVFLNVWYIIENINVRLRDLNLSGQRAQLVSTFKFLVVRNILSQISLKNEK